MWDSYHEMQIILLIIFKKNLKIKVLLFFDLSKENMS